MNYYIAIGPLSAGKYAAMGILQGLYNNGTISRAKGFVSSGNGIIASIFLIMGFEPREILSVLESVDKSKSPLKVVIQAIQRKVGYIPSLRDVCKKQSLIVGVFTTSGSGMISSESHSYMDVLSVISPSLVSLYNYHDIIYYNSGEHYPVPSTLIDDGETEIISICDVDYSSMCARSLSMLLMSLSTQPVRFYLTRSNMMFDPPGEKNTIDKARDFLDGIDIARDGTLDRPYVKYTVPSDIEMMMRVNCRFS